MEKAEKNSETVPYFQLFRFATTKDKFFMLFGTLCAIFVGIGQPLMTIVFGRVLQCFINYEYALATSSPDLATIRNDSWNQVNLNVIYFFIIGCGVMIFGFGQVTFFNWSGENQTKVNILNLF
jgi:ATP-binding cassette subfamily B (MDR/TAP) protein 1